jgi:hypothetical protein
MAPSLSLLARMCTESEVTLRKKPEIHMRYCNSITWASVVSTDSWEKQEGEREKVTGNVFSQNKYCLGLGFLVAEMRPYNILRLEQLWFLAVGVRNECSLHFYRPQAGMAANKRLEKRKGEVERGCRCSSLCRSLCSLWQLFRSLGHDWEFGEEAGLRFFCLVFAGWLRWGVCYMDLDCSSEMVMRQGVEGLWGTVWCQRRASFRWFL